MRSRGLSIWAVLPLLATTLIQSFFTPRVLAQGPGAGKKYAVLVGVESYHHASLREPPLKYACDDVTELAVTLRKADYEVALLTDETGGQNAALVPNRENIEKNLSETLRKCRPADTVILAFAGHGLQFAGTPDAYFCPQDARPFADEAATLVSITRIYSELEKSFAGVKIIFVDACRNDPTPGRGRGIDADSAPHPPRGVAALFSCSAGQRAFEHDNLKHGVFFDRILKGLQGEAADREGEITFQLLSNYVSAKVPGDVSRLLPDQKQFPNMKADLVGIPPVLARVAIAPAVAPAPVNPAPVNNPRPQDNPRPQGNRQQNPQNANLGPAPPVPPVGTAPQPVRKVALFVGVNKYLQPGLDTRTTSYAEKDVLDLADILKNKGQFEVTTLTGSAATKVAIVKAINELLTGRTPRDIVFIGFAGHGTRLPFRDANGKTVIGPTGEDMEDAFFCPSDARVSETNSLISLTGLLNELRNKGGINLVMMDARYGFESPSRNAKPNSGNELNGRLPHNTSILFSCADGQQSLETKDLGGGHGVFFHHVLEGLNGAAAGEKGQVAWDDLVVHVRKNVDSSAKRHFSDLTRSIAASKGLELETVRLQTPHELRNMFEDPVLIAAP